MSPSILSSYSIQGKWIELDWMVSIMISTSSAQGPFAICSGVLGPPGKVADIGAPSASPVHTCNKDLSFGTAVKPLSPTGTVPLKTQFLNLLLNQWTSKGTQWVQKHPDCLWTRPCEGEGGGEGRLSSSLVPSCLTMGSSSATNRARRDIPEPIWAKGGLVAYLMAYTQHGPSKAVIRCFPPVVFYDVSVFKVIHWGRWTSKPQTTLNFLCEETCLECCVWHIQ